MVEIDSFPWNAIKSRIGHISQAFSRLLHRPAAVVSTEHSPALRSWHSFPPPLRQKCEKRSGITKPIGSMYVCHINGLPFTININPSYVSINLPYDWIRHGNPPLCHQTWPGYPRTNSGFWLPCSSRPERFNIFSAYPGCSHISHHGGEWMWMVYYIILHLWHPLPMCDCPKEYESWMVDELILKANYRAGGPTVDEVSPWLVVKNRSFAGGFGL